LNTDISASCKCFGLYDENKIIGFMGVLHQPHGKIKNLKRCSRLVILPDYQGIGLGTKFLDAIAQYYKNLNYKFSIVTSAKNMIQALNKNPKWAIIRYCANKNLSEKSKIDYKRKSMRTNCKTASFMYK
jgi:GNAT superfamily N-acetyltransferase